MHTLSEKKNEAGGPLERFLPLPVFDSALDTIRQRFAASAWLLDPFGASPRLAGGLARSGIRLLVTVNNPVLRFLFDLTAHPPTIVDLRLALSALAASRKNGERLEPHLNNLYQTTCAACKQPIPAEAFIWEAKTERLLARIYTCPHCGDQGERPATLEDEQRAADWRNADALHRARALERVAAADDPDRSLAEEALNIYPPRAVYALGTILNRLDSLSIGPEPRRCLIALLLYAFDQCNSLWSRTGDRPRPRQLSTPAQFLETNVWCAFENGLKFWEARASTAPVALSLWPEEPPESGGLCLFEGALRALPAEAPLELGLSASLGVIPRPNPAFTTLSALWAGWLWGREAAAPFKPTLRRRRNDWMWHAAALRAVFTRLRALEKPIYAFAAEVEPDFLSAIALAAQASGWQFHFQAGESTVFVELTPARQQKAQALIIKAHALKKPLQAALESAGKPQPYLPLHAAVLESLARQESLPWSGTVPSRVLQAVREALSDPRFVDQERRAHPQTGVWALKKWQGQELF